MCATPIARMGLTPSAVFTPKLGLWSVMRTRNAGLSTTKYVAIESTKAGTTVDAAGLIARAAGGSGMAASGGAAALAMARIAQEA